MQAAGQTINRRNMASFSAELHVAGVVIPLIRCTYGTHQSTDARGRVITKVRKSPIDCEADVPEHQILDAWAANAHQRQAATIIFRNADTGVAWETLYLRAAYCTSYNEVFVMGDVTSGSYRCFFTLSDPDGWIWNPGGPPNETAIQPPAREHGTPDSVPSLVAPLIDWVEPDRWADKPRSRSGFLGSRQLTRKEVAQWTNRLANDYGVKLEILQKDSPILVYMDATQKQGGFLADVKTIYLRPGPTYYEVAHEAKHAEQFKKLGAERYSLQSRLDKETYVYEELLKDKRNLSSAEVEHATGYINRLRKDHALPSL